LYILQYICCRWKRDSGGNGIDQSHANHVMPILLMHVADPTVRDLFILWWSRVIPKPPDSISYGRHFYVKSLLVSAGDLPFCSRPPAVFQQPPCYFSADPLLQNSRSPAVVSAGGCYTRRSTIKFPFVTSYRIFGK
jgi:hypothetical protein